MAFHWLTCGVLASILVGVAGAAGAGAEDNPAPVQIQSFQPVAPLSRAQRPAEIEAVVVNTTETPMTISARLVLPEGVQALEPEANAKLSIDAKDDTDLVWKIEAAAPGSHTFTLEVTPENGPAATAPLDMLFLAPVAEQKLPYIPEPQPVKTDLLIGAHHCPLWEADKPFMWSQLIKHPERTPALGFYAQDNPEVSDWETKWATEHGISFFIYCWYRASQGEPVKMNFGSAIHEGLFKSRFADKMKFTIMWENQVRGKAGVADEADLMNNLLPFWMENYFKYPGYLKVDNKPVLFVYRPEFLVDDLGSVENVAAAFEKMRQACKDAGFDGLYILGEYRGLDPEHLKLMKRLGLDYTFAYVWYVPDNPTPQQAIDAQMDYLKKTQDLGILPEVATLSQAWSGWNDEGTIWKIPPTDYKTLLEKGKAFAQSLPATELGSKMLLLDNWNEWGEGHYIAPYREYGFGYVDAVRAVFSNAPEPHTDLLPEDIGLGPYDTAYKKQMAQERELKKLVSKKVTKAGAPEKGLVAWWSFDEADDSPVALDYSGNRLGGILRDAKRAPGLDGKALLCDGGCVEVINNPKLSVTDGVTIACWVKTDLAGQENTWVVNRVLQGGTATGYRLGVVSGKPCFEVPLTEWSHHLSAKDSLPTGRWVYLAGTFDGKTERIYVDGEERGAMDRPGPIATNNFHLCLGNYDVKHASHFTGLLDEVKLYDRALSPEEIRAQYAALAPKSPPAHE